MKTSLKSVPTWGHQQWGNVPPNECRDEALMQISRQRFWLGGSWRSLRTDIGTKLPRGSAVSNPHLNWLSFDLWTKLCLQTSRKYHSLIFLSAQLSFFNLAEFHLPRKLPAHFRTAPYLCISPLWPLWSSPWLPLWLSVSLNSES